MICLECSDDEMLRRLRKRTESSGRIDDNPEALKKRLDTYQKESIPVVDHLRERGSVKIVCLRCCFPLALAEQTSQIDCHGSPDDVYVSLKPIVEDFIRSVEASS